jgi:hypothetical protein
VPSFFSRIPFHINNVTTAARIVTPAIYLAISRPECGKGVGCKLSGSNTRPAVEKRNIPHTPRKVVQILRPALGSSAPNASNGRYFLYRLNPIATIKENTIGVSISSLCFHSTGIEQRITNQNQRGMKDVCLAAMGRNYRIFCQYGLLRTLTNVPSITTTHHLTPTATEQTDATTCRRAYSLPASHARFV